ncbi:MAG: cbb3-type cytochrome c oxidase subunit I, partial [Vicinamibacterales bacterium]
MVEARTDAAYQVEPDFAARQSILWAIAWLVGGVTITLAVHALLLWPDILAKVPLVDLSYGRLRSVSETTIVFGWLGTIGFAVIFAILPRIAGVQLHNEVLGAATTLTWSLLLTGGIVAVLLGVNQGRLLAELPAGADLGLGLMLVLVLFNAGVTIVSRRERTLYVSGWYMVAAALLAPIVWVAGNLPVFSGVTDTIVAGFYLNGVELLWLLPLGLAAAYYVVPVETGNPLFSAALARAGFWSLVFAGGWTGQRFFLAGPAPDYLDVIAVGMSFVLLIPVLSSAANLLATGRGRWHLVTQAFGLRFAVAGIGLLLSWIVLVVFSTVPSVSRFVGLTGWQAGIRHLAMFGVFTSFAFAFVYHAYPLMVGRDWYSRTLSAFHFWTTQVGVVAGTAMLLATGAAQSVAGDAQIIPVLRIATALCFAAVAIAQYAFAYNIFRTARSGPIVGVWAPG